MAIRIAIVGPGRVGQALGRRWAEAGLDLLGFVGRDPQRTAAALAFCGAGRALLPDDLPRAHAVVFAVGDADLPAAVEALAPQAVRECSLWLHTSGSHGLEVFAPLAGRPVRCGALHPAAPFPDAATGHRLLAGRPAVLLGEPRAERLLEVLAAKLPMRALRARAGGDRALYHAACALAANGTTALFAAAERILQASLALDPADARSLVQDLAAAAVDAAGRDGPVAALSGPVVRGDAATVARHRRHLATFGDEAAVYAAVQRFALALAVERGLSAAAAESLRAVLGAAEDAR